MPAAMLHAQPCAGTADLPSPAGWRVGGRRCANSAAKFWPALLDEILACFPACIRVELTALGAGQLDATKLYPARALAAWLENGGPRDPAAELRQVIAEMELDGPPPAVGVKLFDAARCLYDDLLPAEAVDAEIFLYLLAWLLAWSGVPPDRWRQPQVGGAFGAADVRRRRRYAVHFELDQSRSHEGLTWRVLTLHAMVEAG